MVGINRRRGALKHMPVHVGPNMTPMVDVVMCILIFFMLGSSLVVPDLFLKSNTAAVEKAGLGTEAATAKLPSVRMNIVLSRDVVLGVTKVAAFDEVAMEMNAVEDTDQRRNDTIFAKLASRRKSISDDVQVLIVPGTDVPWQDVITIYDFCTELAFKQVAFYPAK